MSKILKGLTESTHKKYDNNRTGFSRGPRDDERHDFDVQKPTKEEWDAESKRQEKLAELNQYKMQRMLEYPDMREYLDGVVKGDAAQMQAYIDKCNAVKAKYPKPEVSE